MNSVISLRMIQALLPRGELMDKTMTRLLSAIAIQLSTFTAMSHLAVAQTVPTTPQLTTPPQKVTTPQSTTPQQGTTTPQLTTPQQKVTTPQSTAPQPTTLQDKTQKICAFNPTEDSLPPVGKSTNSSGLSYLQQQGFKQAADGSWVCYVNDSQNGGRYYTLFKVEQINGKLVATTFLDHGALLPGQENRSVDLFMTLIGNYTKIAPENRPSIKRYLEAFTSLVKQGKIPPSNHAYLFDQPNRGFVIYHPLTGGKLQGTAITINIDLPQKSSSSPVF